jgi:hypothetical protein
MILYHITKHCTAMTELNKRRSNKRPPPALFWVNVYTLDSSFDSYYAIYNYPGQVAKKYLMAHSTWPGHYGRWQIIL